MRPTPDTGSDPLKARPLAARLLPWRIFRRILREEVPRRSALGREALLVLAVHAVVLLIALWNRWMLSELIWALFWRSVLGFGFALRRPWVLESADLTGLKVPDGLSPGDAPLRTKVGIGALIVLIGLPAHLFYAAMLSAFTARWPQGTDGVYAGVVLAILALQSFAANQRQIALDRLHPPVLDAVVAFPFLSLVFLHGTLMIGVLLGTGTAMTLAFLVLKAVFEVSALAWEREFAFTLAIGHTQSRKDWR